MSAVRATVLATEIPARYFSQPDQTPPHLPCYTRSRDITHSVRGTIYATATLTHSFERASAQAS